MEKFSAKSTNKKSSLESKIRSTLKAGALAAGALGAGEYFKQADGVPAPTQAETVVTASPVADVHEENAQRASTVPQVEKPSYSQVGNDPFGLSGEELRLIDEAEGSDDRAILKDVDQVLEISPGKEGSALIERLLSSAELSPVEKSDLAHTFVRKTSDLWHSLPIVARHGFDPLHDPELQKIAEESLSRDPYVLGSMADFAYQDAAKASPEALEADSRIRSVLAQSANPRLKVLNAILTSGANNFEQRDLWLFAEPLEKGVVSVQELQGALHAEDVQSHAELDARLTSAGYGNLLPYFKPIEALPLRDQNDSVEL